MTVLEKHVVNTENAEKIWDWLQNRGGILIWESINLSNPGAHWTTPAHDSDGQPMTKPTWQVGNDARLIVDPADVLVSIDREVKRFRVAVRMGSQGLTLKVTDAGSRRIRREVEKAGKGAYHQFDYSTQEAVIFTSDRTLPIQEYIETRGGKQ